MRNPNPASANLRLIAWRLALGLGMAAWFVKSKLQISLFFQGPEQSIRHHSLLPTWLCSPVLGGVLYFTPLLTLLALRAQRIRWLRLAAATYATCSLLMLWHVQSYNDATQVTGFYTALWLWWWAGQVPRTDAASYWHGITLALGVLSLCWLGGAVGKITPEYWSGEPFYHLYFMDKPQFPFDWWREHCTTETLHGYARIFSRLVVVSELALATSLLWPVRLAVLANMMALCGMVIISQLQLFSVLGSLMGLVIAIAWLLRSPPPSPPSIL